jgi:exodeoxyribonuclease V alpha subunit
MNDTVEYLSGTIERITYQNLENGFCVLRVKVKRHKDLVTVVGSTPSASVGEYIKCSGVWHNDYNHGKQFKASFLKSLPPETLEGIEKYLGSGLIKGIGPTFAKKLVSAFGDKIFDVIENTPENLSTLSGIGKVRAKSICVNWKDQKIIREIMVFLQSHGIGTTRATRIYKTYGDKSIEIIASNPYQLAKDIRGIGFVSADTIAENLGVAKDSLVRARAGVAHVLLEATSSGHCGLPKESLIGDTKKLLEVEDTLVELALSEEVKINSLIIDTLNGREAVFLSIFHFYEKSIASMLLNLTKAPVPWSKANSDTSLELIEKKLDISLAESQKLAIKKAIKHKLMIVTGGPGTGKTTLLNAMIKVLEEKKLNIKLCAPTGRAAKRLSEATGLEAITIHRLLETDPAHGGFKKDKDFPLECDYLVIDEVSMVDVPLFHSLLKALPTHSGLLLVGDADQLPSVGAGQALKDMINSKAIQTIELIEIFRQSATSKIITNARSINQGIVPILTPSKQESDFYFIETELGEDIINKIIVMVKDRIPTKFNLDPINDIQLLCPMQRGGVGARSINTELQKSLNPNYSSGVSRFGQIFAVNDKVMQTENNYDKDVYNGDIGIVTAINEEEQEVIITFDERNISYEYNDLDQITLAYATTIHKSQGSEYPAVIIPITMQSYMMLKRNLIYTAVTRAKQLVVIIGQKKALTMAIKNSNALHRHTKLKEWLC